jgi:hypothetical protein
MASLPPADPVCHDTLWDGVTCDLPCGHIGSHMRAATPGMAALTWRSSAPPPPKAAELRVDYLQLLRASRKSA